MKAMVLERLVSIETCDQPLRSMNVAKPEPQTGEICIAVTACGVCHTELDEIEGRSAPPRLPIIPGHEVVGRVESIGPSVRRFRPGDRVGVGWIHSSDGSNEENLSLDFRATGRDANGGYAEFMTVGEDYAYPIPEQFTDAEAAPLLCAGAIGYRALRLCGLSDGQRLGLTGFGGSAHIVLQLARHLYPRVVIHVFARDAGSREFAKEMGADWVGPTEARAPAGLDAIIDTTPAWTPVVSALANLKPGGRLVINAIRKEDTDKIALQDLSYHEHLWMEREVKSVANITRRDIAEFLPLAAEIPIRPAISVYSLADANQALVSLKREPVRGAKVLLVNAST
ncbi:MAG: zinc-dependent alcohol dehydrogenase family protein [Gammaproteobacteria bacterium]|nr:zinc-dependent alcohol dehydrogenase family protein [Gammaproteobacteria bacterium]NNL49245.1 zinc-dependent alcohol dehydrogenase family protein [Woeseiaceae bacterium]